MLKKALRLRSKRDFDKLYKIGKRVQTDHLRLWWAGLGQNFPRFGFVVSKKQVKKIVERNRVKRILREEIKNFLPRIPKGTDMVFHIRGDKGKVGSVKIREELEKIFKISGIIK